MASNDLAVFKDNNDYIRREVFEARMDKLEAVVDTKIMELRVYIDGRFVEFQKDIDGRFKALEEKFNGKIQTLEDKFEKRFQNIETRLTNLETEMRVLSTRMDGLEHSIYWNFTMMTIILGFITIFAPSILSFVKKLFKPSIAITPEIIEQLKQSLKADEKKLTEQTGVNTL